MTLFWDRQNRPIEDTLDWARKFEDPAYRLVAVDQDAPGHPMVSTIWQGLDLAHSLHVSDQSAVIFETAYLEDGEVVQAWQWHSEVEALSGHNMICAQFLGRFARPSDGHVRTIIENEREEREQSDSNA